MISEVIVAPHLDDAVLSSWHQIDQADSQTLTIFAGIPDHVNPSWWDRITSHTDAQVTMRVRREENSLALSSTPTLITNLDLLDRPYTKAARDIETIANAVETNIPSTAPLVVAAGVGTLLRQHPDHKTTRQVGLELRERGRDITFYADIPYALPIRNFESWPSRLPVEKLKRILDSNIEIETIELSEEEQVRKQSAVRTFESQYNMVNVIALGALSRAAAYKWEALIHCF